MSVSEVAPGIGVKVVAPLLWTSHWTVGFGVPEAACGVGKIPLHPGDVVDLGHCARERVG